MKVHATFFGRVLINSDYKSVVTWREPRGLYNVQKNIRDEKLFKLKTDLCQSIYPNNLKSTETLIPPFKYTFLLRNKQFSVFQSANWLNKHKQQQWKTNLFACRAPTT